MSTPYFFVEEHSIVEALFDEGLDFFHLRKPHTEPVYSERLLSLLPEQNRKRIVAHDHFYLQSEFKLWGIHPNVRSELPDKYSGHVACTCRTPDEVEKLRKKCSYVIYYPQSSAASDSSEKATSFSSLPNNLNVDKRVMAMGDISLDNISQVKNLGFGGAVIYGSLWNLFDRQSTQDYRELINYFRKLRKASE